MKYRCEILNHRIDGYEVWLHGRNQGRSGVNGSKSKLLYFKGRSSTIVPSEVLVNGEIVAISDKTVHLGHTIYYLCKRS